MVEVERRRRLLDDDESAPVAGPCFEEYLTTRGIDGQGSDAG